jgi:RNA polymerase sigma factor (TIGR02999 family)
MDHSTQRASLDKAFIEVHAQLRRLAKALMSSERPGHTLEATAAVHEVYLRLLRSPPPDLDDPRRFLATAATSLRRVLIDHGRRRHAQRRRHRREAGLAAAAETASKEATGLVEVAEALDLLERQDPRSGRVAELRLLGGLSIEEIAGEVGISKPTVERDWRFARAWLAEQLGGDPMEPGDAAGPLRDG